MNGHNEKPAHNDRFCCPYGTHRDCYMNCSFRTMDKLTHRRQTHFVSLFVPICDLLFVFICGKVLRQSPARKFCGKVLWQIISALSHNEWVTQFLTSNKHV